MQPIDDPTDIAILTEYPLPLANSYHQALIEEDAFFKPKTIINSLQILLKYCLIITLHDSFRTRVVRPHFSSVNIDQMAQLNATQTYQMLVDTLKLFGRYRDNIIDTDLFLFLFEDFKEDPQVRSDTEDLIKSLLALADKYQEGNSFNANICKQDYQDYLPLLRDLFQRANFLTCLPLLYFHDPMDENEAIEQPKEESFSAAEPMMGLEAISQALATRRLPGAPFGRLVLRAYRTNTVLSLHPLMMMVETIEMTPIMDGDNLSIGPHLIIFYDEIRGKDREKLLRHWQLMIPTLSRDKDSPKITNISSQGGIFNQLASFIGFKQNTQKTRNQMAQQIAKLIEQRNLLGAINEYKKIYELEKHNYAIAARLAELYLIARQRQEALNIFQELGEHCVDDGLVPQAMLMFQRVSKLNPKDIDAHLKLANLCAEQGCDELALQQCELIVESSLQINYPPGAIRALELAVQVNPRDPEIQQRLANHYLENNNRAAALKSLLAAGEELVRQGNASTAQSIYERVLQLKPYHQQAYAMLGQIYLDADENDKALEMLIPSYQSDPANVDLLRCLGQAYLNKNMLEEAEETFSTLFALDKTCYKQMIELGRRLLFRGDLDRVGTIIERCLYTMLGQGIEKEVIALLESCLAHNPQHLPSLKRLVDIYLLIRDNDNLRRSLQRLATEARMQGDANEAKMALRQLVSIDPRPEYIAQLRALEGPIRKTIGLKHDR